MVRSPARVSTDLNDVRRQTSRLGKRSPKRIKRPMPRQKVGTPHVRILRDGIEVFGRRGEGARVVDMDENPVEDFGGELFDGWGL